MTINRFEDLIAWQKARQLVTAIYQTTGKGAFAKDYGLRDQIQRSAVSVMSNIAEGFDRGSRPEFHKFLVIAKGSCAEARSQLYIALDCGYINQQEFDRIADLAHEVAKIVGVSPPCNGSEDANRPSAVPSPKS
jgi:four helix bundle protein